MKNLMIICLVLICSACAAKILGLAERYPGLSELRDLCKKDAGLTVYKKVEADGYFDDTTKCHHCWIGLINSPFKYIEYCDFDSVRHPLTNILKEHGCYRLTKVKRNSGLCHAGIEKSVQRYVTEPTASFKKTSCIQLEAIDKPHSQYMYTVRSLDNWIDKEKGVLISKSISRMEDVRNISLIAENNYNSLTPGGAATRQFKPAIDCNSIYITGHRSSRYTGAGDPTRSVLANH